MCGRGWGLWGLQATPEPWSLSHREAVLSGVPCHGSPPQAGDGTPGKRAWACSQTHKGATPSSG